MNTFNSILIDQSVVENQFMGDIDFCVQAIDVYNDCYPDFIKNMQQALNEGKKDLFLKYMHGLKGSMSVFGDCKTYRTMVEIYENGKFGQIDVCISEFYKQQSLFNQYLEELVQFKKYLMEQQKAA